jgi:hypothetical protein
MLKILSVSGFAVLLLSVAGARADQATGDLHLCNADEIIDLPVLQSAQATDCTNNQTTEPTPKALMCAKGGKAYCCTQKLDNVSNCEPITEGKKRSVPIRDPMQAAPGVPAPGYPMPEMAPPVQPAPQ